MEKTKNSDKDNNKITFCAYAFVIFFYTFYFFFYITIQTFKVDPQNRNLLINTVPLMRVTPTTKKKTNTKERVKFGRLQIKKLEKINHEARSSVP